MEQAIALSILRSRLRQAHLEAQAAMKAEHAASLDENGFSSQIRSYVMHPYSLVKDARTGCTEVRTDRVLDGELDPFLRAHLAQRDSKGRVEARVDGC